MKIKSLWSNDDQSYEIGRIIDCEKSFLVGRMSTDILILCTGNSCRSQMAEAILAELAGDRQSVASAGCSPSGYVHPFAIEVMSEIGLEIGDWRSKSHSEFLDRDVHTVITVCGNADQCCPTFPGQVNRYHWPFDDPA
ncbi:arsenate reductase ArsC [Verrucomicrobiaceae bacterium 227]